LGFKDLGGLAGNVFVRVLQKIKVSWETNVGMSSLNKVAVVC
jgi:hypothetical protein